MGDGVYGTDALVLIIPVLMMGFGQLAGGLAWLAISSEDAPDMVVTAPVTATRIIRARVETVLRTIMIVVAPFVVAFALVSVRQALVLAAGAALSAISATMVQLWFRAQARRAQFHRRQTSSRIATFAEAFSSIGWAGGQLIRKRLLCCWFIFGIPKRPRAKFSARDDALDGSFAPHVGHGDQLWNFPIADIDDVDTEGRSCAP